MECILEQSCQANIVPLSVSGSVSSIGIDNSNDTCTDVLYTGMLVTFETMTMGKQKQWQGQSQGNGNDNLYSFVVLAMLKALAMAKNVVSLVVCTMAKTLINNACIHVQIVSEQLLAAEDKLKHRAAVAYVLQQHVALTMVTKAMAKAKAMAMTSLFPLWCWPG